MAASGISQNTFMTSPGVRAFIFASMRVRIEDETNTRESYDGD
jgi:hypothetical protein